MTSHTRARRASVSLWLPIAILLLGLVFLIFVIVEYQRNSALVEQNRALISASAKARLSNSVLNRGTSDNWAQLKGDYEWVQYAPSTYWFSEGVQEFPWSRPSLVSGSDHPQEWSRIWADLNSSSPSMVNQQRLALLNKVKAALNSSDEARISQSFNAYLEHNSAYQLSPQQEVAFSLKLIDIGVDEHWSSALVHATLITGGSSEAPILRPTIDVLFRHAELFSNKELKSIVAKVEQHLEKFNLPGYFLNDYLQHLEKPKFTMPHNLGNDDRELNIIVDGHWFVQRVSKTTIYAEPIFLKEDLQLIEREFIQQNVLTEGDSLLLGDVANSMSIENIGIKVTKKQLDNDKRNQIAYLVIKSVMLVAFVALILLTLRLIDKNQQRRFEYLALREDFVKLVSHELKTPLAGIRAMAETLRKRVERGMSVEAYPERIVSEADKLWYMVDNILGFNRVQLSDAIIDKRPIKIKPICDAIIEDVRSFSNKPYSVSNNIEDSIEALVDAELFSLVVKNIIVNAGLYNKQEIVEIELSFNKAQACLLISDNGVGIAEADRHKIFKPFVRLAQSVRQSGTGLGLAICKRIMQLHKGDLSLAQSSKQGSVWKISLAK